MKRSILFTLILLACVLLPSSLGAIIPIPQSFVKTASSFTINAKTAWIVENEEQAEIAKMLSQRIEKSCRILMPVLTDERNSKNCIRFTTNPSMKEEEYTLTIDSKNILIEAASPKGFFYATQSLRQLLPAQIENGSYIPGGGVTVPGGIIKDNPYLDVRALKFKKQARGLSKAQMLEVLDVVGLHKLNRVYWNPVDEYGNPFDKDIIHEIGSYATKLCIELTIDETKIDDQLSNPNLDNTIILEPEEMHCSLKDIYMYKPGSGLRYSDHLQGMIGNILGTKDDINIYDIWRSFPNTSAFAQICWAGNKEKDWKQFVKNLDYILPIYEALNIDFSKSMYELYYSTNVKDRKVQLHVISVRPDIDIRYTLGGETPTRLSNLLTNPLMITEDKNIFAIGFQDEKEISDPLFLDFHFNKATSKPIFSPKSKTPSILVDGLRAFPDETFGWVYYPDQKAVMTVDLMESTPVQSVSFGILGGAKAIVYVSQDGARFTEVGSMVLNDKDINYKLRDLNSEGRFIKLVIEPSFVPEGEILRLDEIIIE